MNTFTDTKEAYRDILKDLTHPGYGHSRKVSILTGILGIFFVIGIIFVFGFSTIALTDLAMAGKVPDSFPAGLPIMFILGGACFFAYLSYHTNMPGTGGWSESMYDTYTQLENTIQSDTYSLDEVLEKTKRIYRFVQRVISLKKRIHLFNPKSQKAIQQISEQTPIVMLDLLGNIRRTLVHRIETEQNQLEKVQSDVQSVYDPRNILTLQQARLDRQIEQFEELQRVLVRV